MGTKELRDTFNLIAAPAFNCTKAYLGYERSHDTEWQKITFSGTKADGTAFLQESALIRPNGDVIVAAKETAQKLIKPQGAT